MHKGKFLVLNLIAAFLAQADIASASNTRNLLPVIVTGIRNDKGMVVMLLYDQQLRYVLRRPIDVLTAKIEKGEAIATFDLELIKQCVVVVFHDENSNNRLDKTILGKPKEGTGISNNQSSSHRPKFKTVMIKPNGNPLIINLKYR